VEGRGAAPLPTHRLQGPLVGSHCLPPFSSPPQYLLPKTQRRRRDGLLEMKWEIASLCRPFAIHTQ